MVAVVQGHWTVPPEKNIENPTLTIDDKLPSSCEICCRPKIVRNLLIFQVWWGLAMYYSRHFCNAENA